MNSLLTIAIPTFNRAHLLDRQLAWLANSINSFESECEIIISDNCSTDTTPKVIQKWQPIFASTQLHINRNSENIGAIKNIAYCINNATSKYVWTISDDDTIYDQTLAYVLKNLRANPELSLLILNFSNFNIKTNQQRFLRCFDVENDDVNPDGKAVFERCLLVDFAGGVALTTALVYRTATAQRALQEWTSGLDNLAVQIYITGFCALHGSVKVTQDAYLQCNTGTNFWKEDSKLAFQLRYLDIPAVFYKLSRIGYSKKLCLSMIFSQYERMIFDHFHLRSFYRGLKKGIRSRLLKLQ
jgi:abequosyltransferase